MGSQARSEAGREGLVRLITSAQELCDGSQEEDLVRVRKRLYALPGAYFSRTMHAKKGVKSAPERTTTAVEYHAHTGRPSWHQARAGGISSGVGVYSTREA